MISDDTPKSIKDTAIEFLHLQQTRYAANQRTRPYLAKLAHDHGVTHREIGEIYGVTEAAVRAMIKRSAV